MALAAAHTIFGEQSQVCDIRFEEMLLLDDQTPIGAVASVEEPGVAGFVVQTEQQNQRCDEPAQYCRPYPRKTGRPPMTWPIYCGPIGAATTAPRCESGSGSVVFG